MFEQIDKELQSFIEMNDSSNNSSKDFNPFDLTKIDPCEFMFSDDKFEFIMSIIGTIICIIGIIGNIFSIIVLCKKSMKKLSTYAYLLGNSKIVFSRNILSIFQ